MIYIYVQQHKHTHTHTHTNTEMNKNCPTFGVNLPILITQTSSLNFSIGNVYVWMLTKSSKSWFTYEFIRMWNLLWVWNGDSPLFKWICTVGLIAAVSQTALMPKGGQRVPGWALVSALHRAWPPAIRVTKPLCTGRFSKTGRAPAGKHCKAAVTQAKNKFHLVQ
jgi:hypothetical protein